MGACARRGIGHGEKWYINTSLAVALSLSFGDQPCHRTPSSVRSFSFSLPLPGRARGSPHQAQASTTYRLKGPNGVRFGSLVGHIVAPSVIGPAPSGIYRSSGATDSIEVKVQWGSLL